MAGTSSERTMSASMRTPAASPVASTCRSVSPEVAIAANARKTISAALVTSRPVPAIPRTTASSVEPVRSYSSRILARMNTS